MRITTLNLQGFSNWQERQDVIIDYLRTTDSDIVMFQEVIFIPEISTLNQVQLLNKSLKYPYESSDISRLQAGVEYKTYREGLSFISKHPIAKSDTIVLRKDPRDEHNRIIQLIDLLIGDKVVKLANVHFSITDEIDFASPQLNETLDLLRARDEKRIIGGDFNLDHLEDFADVWQDDYTATLEPGYISYPGMNKRNDYFLVPKELPLGDIQISPDGLSDHRAITVDLDIAT